MNKRKPVPDPATAGHIHDEADIGSGEKTPAEKETEEMIRQIPTLPPSNRPGQPAHGPGKTGSP